MRRWFRPSLPLAKQLRWQGQLHSFLPSDRDGLLANVYAQCDKHLCYLQLGHSVRPYRQVARRHVQVNPARRVPSHHRHRLLLQLLRSALPGSSDLFPYHAPEARNDYIRVHPVEGKQHARFKNR